jgi:2-succinyl-5-enolpyruvyl-6-hydroxy-3-cyclohexene-1-carboxylate synthase
VDHAAALTTRLVAALADLGLRHAVVSPGSRNTPLTLAFAIEPRIVTHVMLDERSAGFFALGIAKQSGVPAVLVSTSGTAAANYLPAVVEASLSRHPLLVLTADRPPELRGTGAPQTIDQIGLYGTAVRLFHDVGVPDAAIAASAPSLALRTWSAALDAPHGPVHLNFPFREPLATPMDPASPTGIHHRRGEVELPPEDLGELAAHLSGRRVLIVAGGHQRPGFAAATAMLAGEAAFPVVADVQCRFPSPSTIAHADVLATAGFFERHDPDLIVRVGPVPTSKPVWTWLARTAAEQMIIDDAGWRDAPSTATSVYRADPAATFADLAGRVAPAPDGWLRTWQDAERSAAGALDAAMDAAPFPNEPGIARDVWESSPPGSTVFVGSSMPVRDLDAFSGMPRGDVAVLAHRGASGIDGLLSAAAGASVSDGRRVVVLAGDLSVLHDATALGVIARHGLPVTVVAVDNDGGGIFHFLPQADRLDRDRFEMLYGTPHGHSLDDIARAFGMPVRVVDSRDDLRDAVASAEGPIFILIRSSRRDNVAVHERLRHAVADAVG